MNVPPSALQSLPKVARVAALYEPAIPASVHEVKEVLPAAAHARLTLRSSEARDTGGFERVFAALNKQRPDRLFLTQRPLMLANGKRIADFALKSKLPSMYIRKEFVESFGSLPAVQP